MNPETTTLPTIETLEFLAQQMPAAEHAQTTSRVVKILTTAMNNGVLLPGQQLSEIRCAEILQVSRNTLRQAFMILGSKHLVVQIPNRGVFISIPGQEQISEMFIMRRALETTAISLIPQGQHFSLREILQRAQKAKERFSVSRMALENQNFHRELVALAGSTRLSESMESILAEMRLLFHSMVTKPEFHADFVDENLQLLEFIESGQTSKAIEFLEKYLEKSQAYFIGML